MNTATFAAPRAPETGLRIWCEPGIADWVPAAMERCHGSLYATLTQIRLGHGLRHAWSYVEWDGGAPVTVLVFRLAPRRIDVLSEVLELSQQQVERFVHTVLSRFPPVRVVTFRAIATPPPAPGRVAQYYDYLEDTVVALPATTAAYFAALSKNARRNVQREQRWAETELPGYRFCSARGADAGPERIGAIIALNHARMQAKLKRSDIDRRETERLLTLLGERGTVAWIEVDGRIAAGALSCTVGDQVYLLVLAHDPRYNAYGLGFLCCYLAIGAAIEQGGRGFHFLWGRYAYKRSFLGQPQPLFRLLIYRSRAAQLACAPLAAAAWAGAARRRLRRWVQEGGQAGAPLPRRLLQLFGRLQQLRAAARRLLRPRSSTSP